MLILTFTFVSLLHAGIGPRTLPLQRPSEFEHAICEGYLEGELRPTADELKLADEMITWLRGIHPAFAAAHDAEINGSVLHDVFFMRVGFALPPRAPWFALTHPLRRSFLRAVTYRDPSAALSALKTLVSTSISGDAKPLATHILWNAVAALMQLHVEGTRVSADYVLDADGAPDGGKHVRFEFSLSPGVEFRPPSVTRLLESRAARALVYKFLVERLRAFVRADTFYQLELWTAGSPEQTNDILLRMPKQAYAFDVALLLPKAPPVPELPSPPAPAPPLDLGAVERLVTRPTTEVSLAQVTRDLQEASAAVGEVLAYLDHHVVPRFATEAWTADRARNPSWLGEFRTRLSAATLENLTELGNLQRASAALKNLDAWVNARLGSFNEGTPLSAEAMDAVDRVLFETLTATSQSFLTAVDLARGAIDTRVEQLADGVRDLKRLENLVNEVYAARLAGHASDPGASPRIRHLGARGQD